MTRALGSIVSTTQREPTVDEVHCGLFDYYDHYLDKDPRLGEQCEPFSVAADILAHDLVNLSVYAMQILRWLEPTNIRSEASVVVAGAMSEAFFVSARSACDALGTALACAAARKRGQAPTSSLGDLLRWVKRHEKRVAPDAKPAFNYDFTWFWALRSIRDHLVHNGVHGTVHCNGRQFNLWLHHPTRGWIMREPLLPLLATTVQDLLHFMDHASEHLHRCIPIPHDRHGTRMLHGVTIHSLHKLIEIAPDYAEPSP